MTMSINFTTFEMVTISINLLTLVVLVCLFVRSHNGDCQGTLLSKVKTSDGQSVIREAKLSMHDRSHDDEI
jgi:hypothetical protein